MNSTLDTTTAPPPTLENFNSNDPALGLVCATLTIPYSVNLAPMGNFLAASMLERIIKDAVRAEGIRMDSIGHVGTLNACFLHLLVPRPDTQRAAELVADTLLDFRLEGFAGIWKQKGATYVCHLAGFGLPQDTNDFSILLNLAKLAGEIAEKECRAEEIRIEMLNSLREIRRATEAKNAAAAQPPPASGRDQPTA